MPEFGRRQYRETHAETSDMMKWVISSAVAVLIAGLFLSYRLFIHPGNPDPLLNKRGSFAEMVQRNAFSADQLLEHPSSSTTVVLIPFGKKVYKVPHKPRGSRSVSCRPQSSNDDVRNSRPAPRLDA